MTNRSALTLLAVAAICLGPGRVQAQADTVVVVAGPRYATGELGRTLLGDDYRDVWTLAIRVPVLDLDTFAGGLRPERRGGGEQTKVLHLTNIENREFVFRSVDKDPALLDEPALQNTVISRIVRDQVSSLHPGAAAVVPTLLDAVDLKGPDPTLVVLPDDPALGEFREEFGGVLGWIEERPDEIRVEGTDSVLPGFGGYSRIISTARLLERLEEGADDRVESRDYLTARLVDLLIGDWDRHADQWRWAEVERDGISYWIPIPRDRDYAFVHYDGWVLSLARSIIRNVVRFDRDIDDLGGLLLNARDLDRRLLAEPGLAEWDSIAGFVQAQLSDSVIAEAVAALPPEYREASGAELEAVLRARRDDLGRVAREFYGQLATAVEVRATDEADLALVDRRADGVVQVRLYERPDEPDEPRGEPYFQRIFYAPESQEVRIYLHGGDDRAVVRGSVGRSLDVRVIGGGGDDLLVDSSAVLSGGAGTGFYDDRGDNEFVRGPDTFVDEKPYEAPAAAWSLSGESFRDWGQSSSILPVMDYSGTDGLIVGAGPVYTRHAFRRFPYAYQIGGNVRVGLASFNPAVEIFGHFRRANSYYGSGFEIEATKLENFRFFGFGNASIKSASEDLYVVEQDRISFRAYVDRRSPRGSRFAVGPAVVYTNPDVPEESPIGELPRYGNGGFGQLGAWAEAEIDRRAGGAFPRRGYRVEAEADAYPGVLSASGAFGSASLRASTYLTPGAAFPVTLALRAGGERAWGEFPVHDAAFLGGSGDLRGYPFNRFAGDAALFGNAELRAPLTRAVLLVRGTLGAIALADAGRVWYDGTSAGDLHTSVGGGLSFEFELRGSFLGATALYAAGEDGGKFYLTLGAPF